MATQTATAEAVGQTTPNELAEAHLPIVDHVVRQLASRFPGHVDRDELRAAGAAGLVDAAHRYDSSTGVPFPRYANIRVRGAVLDATRSLDWAPRRARRGARELEAVDQGLRNRLQREPTDDEVAAELGVQVTEVRERRSAQLTGALLALDRPVGAFDGETSTLGELIVEQDGAWLPDEALQHSELTGTLRTAIALLPDELNRALTAYHFDGRSLRDIADELGVTEARISQLHLEALRALQAYFATTFEDVTPPPEDAPGKRRRAAYVSQVATNTTWRSRLEGRSSEQRGAAEEISA